MPMSNDELSKLYEALQGVRTTMKFARLVHELCHGVADHVIALIGYEKLRPKSFYAETYTELQLEIGLLDATFSLLEKEAETAEKRVADATETIAQARALERQGRDAPTKNGMNIEEVFDAEISACAFAVANVETLHTVYEDHAKTVRSLLGI